MMNLTNRTANNKVRIEPCEPIRFTPEEQRQLAELQDCTEAMNAATRNMLLTDYRYWEQG